MKKKLLLVTGAGASIDFGFPSVAKIDGLLTKYAASTCNCPCLSDPYTYLKSCIGYKHDNTSFNYEELLYLMERIENSQTECNDDVSRKLFLLSPSFCRVFLNSYRNLRSILIDKLLDYMRTRSQAWRNDPQLFNKFQKFQHFLYSIQKDYDISFVTTNYDNILTEIFPDYNTGFDENGVFQRAQLYNDPNWNKGIYLHGSVHFNMRDSIGVNLHAIFWENNLASNFNQNSYGRSKIYTPEGNQILSSTIIAGLDKTKQLLKEPFLQYYTLLDRLVFEADAILFIGYGFNDIHLNNVFSALTVKSKHKKKVVVIDFKNNEVNPMEYAQNNKWNRAVQYTLSFDAANLRHKKGKTKYEIATSPEKLKKLKILEYAKGTHHNVALWYDGLMSACEHADRIIKHL